MGYPPFWMWLVAASITFLGLLLSRSLRTEKVVNRLPVWLCALLALVALVGMWFVLNAQFGGLAVRLALP